MTIKSAPYFTIYCDFPGCGASPHDFGSEYGAWINAGQAADEAESSEWAVTTPRGDFCPNHVVMNEDGEWVPAENTIELIARQLGDRLQERVDYRFQAAISRIRRESGSYSWNP